MDIIRAFDYFHGKLSAGVVAAAVSGGPDSMALCSALSQWQQENKHDASIHALIVNHNLRDNAATEAEQVKQDILSFPNVTPIVLTREKDDVLQSRVQESARTDRYDLMAAYCQSHDIKTLFLGHHQDDQAETVLFRLAKGSGPDGLSGMKKKQDYKGHLTLCRPFLDIPKSDLKTFCEERNVPFIEDPSNQNIDFARVRLRQARDILSAEGLTNRRLAVLASRLTRQREALENIIEDLYNTSAKKLSPNRIEFDFFALCEMVEEFRLRLILKAIKNLNTKSQTLNNYGPRMEKVETLVHRLFTEKSVTKATLGQCIFTVDQKKQRLIIEPETKAATL